MHPKPDTDTKIRKKNDATVLDEIGIEDRICGAATSTKVGYPGTRVPGYPNTGVRDYIIST